MKYACELCGYVYDEQSGDLRNGIAPGTVFGELPDHFECPGCGYEKEAFNPMLTGNGSLFHLQTQSKAPLRR